MDFLNHKEEGMGFLSGFPPFFFTINSNFICKRLRELKKYVRGCKSVKKMNLMAKL